MKTLHLPPTAGWTGAASRVNHPVTYLFSRHLIYSFFLFLHSLAASLFFISLISRFLCGTVEWVVRVASARYLACCSSCCTGPPPGLCTVTSCCWAVCGLEPAGRKEAA